MTVEHLEGGCLCGAVRYEISGEARTFLHCHCRRCRKATGTGHASNLIVAPDSVRWISGEDKLSSYRVPDAERFRTVFCSVCGSPLPRVAPERGIAVVPAGSLDSLPATRPAARIFWDSRAEWSCDDSALATWPEYPER